jgi:uncharacterized protein YutE (UPF0331/DUF86 family)
VVDPEATTRRLLTLNEALQYLASHKSVGADRLRADATLRAAVERWMQVAIEACIGLAYHVIAERGWTPPDTSRGSFETLAAHDLISPELAARLGMAAGMRNILVHEYAEVDLDVIAAVVREGLGDLRTFGAMVGELLQDA